MPQVSIFLYILVSIIEMKMPMRNEKLEWNSILPIIEMTLKHIWMHRVFDSKKPVLNDEKTLGATCQIKWTWL